MGMIRLCIILGFYCFAGWVDLRADIWRSDENADSQGLRGWVYTLENYKQKDYSTKTDKISFAMIPLATEVKFWQKDKLIHLQGGLVDLTVMDVVQIGDGILSSPGQEIKPGSPTEIQIGEIPSSVVVSNIFFHLQRYLAYWKDVALSSKLSAVKSLDALRFLEPIKVVVCGESGAADYYEKCSESANRNNAAYDFNSDELIFWSRQDKEACKPAHTGADPSVIYHEVTHALIYKLTRFKKETSFSWFAIHEGIADYVAASMLDSAEIGKVLLSECKNVNVKYVNDKGPGFYLRTLENEISIIEDDKQPYTYRDPHVLGLSLASILWKIRNKIIESVGDINLGGSIADHIVLLSLIEMRGSLKPYLEIFYQGLLDSERYLFAEKYRPIIVASFKEKGFLDDKGGIKPQLLHEDVAFFKKEKVKTSEKDPIDLGSGCSITNSVSQPSGANKLLFLMLPLLIPFFRRRLGGY